MRVLLVDDHELFRSGIKLLLSTLDNRVEFIEAGCCEDLNLIEEGSKVDMVLLDFHMPGLEGLEALKTVKLAFESIPIVILSGEEDPQLIRAAIDQGAFGFIPKSSSQEVFIAALKLILAGGVFLPAGVLSDIDSFTSDERVQKSDSGYPRGILASLSDRQSEVLALAIKGKPNKIIARELNISESTVKTHLSNAFRILGVQNRTEAVFVIAKLDMDQHQTDTATD